MSIFHVSKLKKKENIWKDWKGKEKKRTEPKKERHEKFYFSFTPIHCWKPEATLSYKLLFAWLTGNA